MALLRRLTRKFGAGLAQLASAPGADEAFLGVDLDGDGTVTNGSELLGEGTPLILATPLLRAPNGFVALSQFDSIDLLGGNNDDEISSKDEIWHKLMVWHDLDGDAVADDGDVRHPSDYGVKSFKLNYKTREGGADRYGNIVPYWSSARLEKGLEDKDGKRRMKLIDIFFKTYD